MGSAVGSAEAGITVGARVGGATGFFVGFFVGVFVGFLVGVIIAVGALVGFMVGVIIVGALVGFFVGFRACRDMPRHIMLPASAPAQSRPVWRLSADESTNSSKTPRIFEAATTSKRRNEIRTFIILNSNFMRAMKCGNDEKRVTIKSVGMQQCNF